MSPPVADKNQFETQWEPSRFMLEAKLKYKIRKGVVKKIEKVEALQVKE